MARVFTSGPRDLPVHTTAVFKLGHYVNPRWLAYFVIQDFSDPGKNQKRWTAETADKCRRRRREKTVSEVRASLDLRRVFSARGKCG
jgi:hypothetical protein